MIAKTPSPTVVLAGLESAGKSALFRGLTGEAVGDESNFRGSTVVCRQCHLPECQCDLVDTPGIRLGQDSETTRLALRQIDRADVIVLVVRGTHVRSELETLLREIEVAGRRTVVAVTFEDRAPRELAEVARAYTKSLQTSVVLVNARALGSEKRETVLEAIRNARPGDVRSFLDGLDEGGVPAVAPELTLFERPVAGPLAALAATMILFAAPVYLAFILAHGIQPVVDSMLIGPLKGRLEKLPPLLFELLGGNYGAITLGWYSFLWAFPVVLLIGLSVAAVEESGLKDRITSALDPALRLIGLSGRDLIPVLAGFGCNVVAVFQSRSCSGCTRKACVSLTAFGSACSYQIGASLAIFNTAGHPWLFAPYLVVLFVAGALHTRLWHGSLAAGAASPLMERSFLQRPSWRGVRWRVRAVVTQFLVQAMPIFLLICLVAASLQYSGLLDRLAHEIAPVLALFHLPPDVAPGLLFSILRKDGILTLNQGEGNLIRSLHAGQVFLLVYLASTLTACLVTLWTIKAEMGWKFALQLAGRQMTTSLVSAWLLSIFI